MGGTKSFKISNMSKAKKNAFKKVATTEIKYRVVSYFVYDRP